MNPLERYGVRLRHHPVLERNPLWGVVRPLYNTIFGILTSQKGLERTINNTDPIRLDARWRGIQENYEPVVWASLMGSVRTGDIVVDVGAFVGLYTVALAARGGPQGSVTAFEPDPANFRWLRRHVTLNHVEERTRLFQAAVGARVGESRFVWGGEIPCPTWWGAPAADSPCI